MRLNVERSRRLPLRLKNGIHEFVEDVHEQEHKKLYAEDPHDFLQILISV